MSDRRHPVHPDAAFFKVLEHERTHALVTRDVAAIRRLHAPDYELISAPGRVMRLGRYLALMETGVFYAAWDHGPMSVRIADGMAAVRYQARITFPSGNVVTCWHTDLYARQADEWKAIWSQATPVAADVGPGPARCEDDERSTGQRSGMAGRVVHCSDPGHAGWLALRLQLWPEGSTDQFTAEMQALCDRPDRFAQFLFESAEGAALGFIEVAMRADYVNGTESSPVTFVEGIFVAPAARRRGIARALMTSAQDWARTRGCSELASDAPIENARSHDMHAALGFMQTEQVVFFRKLLDP